jgi:hypothetical protein
VRVHRARRRLARLLESADREGIASGSPVPRRRQVSGLGKERSA